MNKIERKLVECVDSFLQQKARLGLPSQTDLEKVNTDNLQFQRSHIDDEFALKAADLIQHTAVCSAFAAVRGRANLNDPAFIPAFENELRGRAVPANERKEAIEIVGKLSKDILGDKDERDFGLDDPSAT